MDWGGRTTWDSFRQGDPLGGGSPDWSLPEMYSYDSRQSSGWGMDYDPSYGRYSAGYDPVSNYSWGLISSNIDSYLQSEYPELFQFDSGSVNYGEGTGGDVSRSGNLGRFHEDPTVYGEIQQAADKYGVPANLLKAMIARESSGHWGAGVSDNGPYDNTSLTWLSSRNQWIAGYTGITEAAATAWGYNIHDLDGNRALQIDAMANGLRRLYDDVGGQYGWEGVINTYYSGDPTGLTTPGDSYQYGTTAVYTNQVMAWWKAEDAWTVQHGGSIWDESNMSFYGEEGDRGPVTTLEAVWGGQDFPVTQQHGNTGWWVQQNPRMYAYSYELLGYLGHPGTDIGMPIGTDIFTPVGGTVIADGGTGSFRYDPSGNAPKTGEIRIRMDNGHEIIFGHMAGIQVDIGQRVQPGQRVGVSGSAGSGPHLHLEYRVPRDDGSWAAIDPFEALAGTFTGSFSGQSAGAGITRPQTFQELLRAGASGGTIYGGSEFSSGSPNTWNAFLQQAMRGQIPQSVGQGRARIS